MRKLVKYEDPNMKRKVEFEVDLELLEKKNDKSIEKRKGFL